MQLTAFGSVPDRLGTGTAETVLTSSEEAVALLLVAVEVLVMCTHCNTLAALVQTSSHLAYTWALLQASFAVAQAPALAPSAQTLAAALASFVVRALVAFVLTLLAALARRYLRRPLTSSAVTAFRRQKASY